MKSKRPKWRETLKEWVYLECVPISHVGSERVDEAYRVRIDRPCKGRRCVEGIETALEVDEGRESKVCHSNLFDALLKRSKAMRVVCVENRG